MPVESYGLEEAPCCKSAVLLVRGILERGTGEVSYRVTGGAAQKASIAWRFDDEVRRNWSFIERSRNQA